MSFDKNVPGCFGPSDLLFASHVADENRAFEWLISLRNRGIGLKEAQDQIERFLRSKGASAQHIGDQIDEAARFLGPWLLD